MAKAPALSRIAQAIEATEPDRPNPSRIDQALTALDEPERNELVAVLNDPTGFSSRRVSAIFRVLGYEVSYTAVKDWRRKHMVRHG